MRLELSGFIEKHNESERFGCFTLMIFWEENVKTSDSLFPNLKILAFSGILETYGYEKSMDIFLYSLQI